MVVGTLCGTAARNCFGKAAAAGYCSEIGAARDSVSRNAIHQFETWFVPYCSIYCGSRDEWWLTITHLPPRLLNTIEKRAGVVVALPSRLSLKV